MGTRHKILEDFYDESFMLIALHSSMEDHVMAFALNSTLKVQFERSARDFDLTEEVSFPMFEWFDKHNDSDWTFFPNSKTSKAFVDDSGLFKNELELVRHHIVPEHKDVDYFIKINPGVEEEIIKTIQEIPMVVTAYMIDCDKLTSKNNLIF